MGRIRAAAMRAAVDPATWIPAVGAVVFSTGNLDQRTSDWAYEHTPLFGSPEKANQASSDLRALTCTGALLTAVAIPKGFGPGDDGLTKTQGVSAVLAAGLINSAAVGTLKEETGKTRPNGNPGSFPSSHTSQAFVCATSAKRNLEAIPMTDRMQKALRWNFTALAAATAWARVEAQHHYPSDALAGAALGNFLTNFIYDAFLKPADVGDGRPSSTDVTLDLADDVLWFRLNRRF